MFVKRLIGSIFVRRGLAVQSFGFNRFLPIGRPEVVAEYLNRWGIDEILLLDIDATLCSRPPDFRMVQRVAQFNFTPLTVGGGVSSIDHFHKLLRAGADKVAVNSALIETPNLLSEAAARFGSQCVIASVDAKETKDGYMTRSQSSQYRIPVKDISKLAEEHGAGELVINSVDRDGMRSGYDIDLLSLVGAGLEIPTIALGGAGHPSHIVEAMKLPAISAVAVGNMFNHMEHSVTIAKAFLAKTTIHVRQATNFDYSFDQFDEDGRLLKKAETRFDDLGALCLESDVL